MINKIVLLQFLGFAALINACTYSENGTHWVEPIPDDPAVASVTTNLDTINNPAVVDSLEVIYDITIQDGELYYVDALVGNRLVYDSDTTNGSFWLYPNDVKLPGIDTLHIYIYYSSNTNSLADLFGIEASHVNLDYAVDFRWGSK